MQNPSAIPATIFGQTSPSSHLDALANNIQAGVKIVEDAKKQKALKEKLLEPFEYDASGIAPQWLPEVQKANQDMLDKHIGYLSKGQNWDDPASGEAYIDNLNTRKEVTNKIDTYKALSKMVADATKTLSDPQTSKFLDYNKSIAKLGEIQALPFDEAMKYAEDNKFNILVPKTNTFDIDAYEKENLQKMLTGIGPGDRFVSSKAAADEANKSIDKMIAMFDNDAVKQEFIQRGGTEEQWTGLKEKYTPLFEEKKYVYDPTTDKNRSAQNFRTTYDKTQNDPNYLASTDQLIKNIQTGDSASAGALVGATITGGGEVVDVAYEPTDKGNTLVLTLSGQEEQTQSGGTDPKTGDAYEDVKVKVPKQIRIDLSDPSNYNEILNYLNKVKGRNTVSIEELDASNKSGKGKSGMKWDDGGTTGKSGVKWE